jgi:PAS domain S-box-containing protein
MILFDETQRVLQVNKALCTLLGYSEQELRGRELTDLVEPRARSDERNRVAALLAGRPRSASLERRYLRKDGSAVWVIVSLGLAHVEAIGIAHVQDITERKQAENDLRSSQERLTEAEQVAQMGSWEYNVQTDRVTWSDGLFQIHGLTPEEFEPSREAGVEQRVFPEDRPLVRETYARALADRGAFTVEYRALRSDGRIRTLRSRCEVVCDSEGNPARIVGVVRDITDAKLAEDALHHRSADLQRRERELQKLTLVDAPERRAQPHAPLTPRQLEILRLIAQGKTSAEIGEELIVSEGTVKWHVKQILAKTASSSRAEAVARVLGSELS